MGNSPDSSKPKILQVVMVGLDSAGKTTLAYKMGAELLQEHVSKHLSSFERFKWENLNILSWDLEGASTKSKPLWSQYFRDCNGIVFVIDSFEKDQERIDLAKNELNWLLDKSDLAGLPLLVLANKQDLEGAMNVDEVNEKFNLDQIKERKWHIQGTSYKDRASILDGFDWFKKAMI